MTTTHLSEEDEKWIVDLEDRIKKLEALMRQRAAVASKPAAASAAAPPLTKAPTSNPNASLDTQLVELIKHKARLHMRTFNYDGAFSKLRDGMYDDELLRIFCNPPPLGK